MTVKFGMIGLGKIARRFASALRSVEGVELSAVAARDPERARAFAQEFNARKAYGNYLDLINDPEVDIVYDALTHNFHYEYTKICLEQHKAVLCEKPFVTTRRDAEELVELASANHTLLMEALWTRCLPVFRKAKEWVQTGRIGQPKLVTASYCAKMDYDPESRLFKAGLAGGSLYDLGIYPIAFTTGILAELPVSASGQAILAPNGVDMAASFSLRFASGALASLNCGFNVDHRAAAVFGTQGALVVENVSGPTWCELYDEKQKLVERFTEPFQNGFLYQIDHAAGLFHQGRIESDLIPWADSIASAGIFDSLLTDWGIRQHIPPR